MYTDITGIHKINFPELSDSIETLLNLSVQLFLKASQRPGQPYYRSFRNLSHSIEIAHIDAAIRRQGLDPKYVKLTPLGKAVADTGIYYNYPAWINPATARRDYRAVLRWVLKDPSILEALLELSASLKEAGIVCSVIDDITGESSTFNNRLYGFPGLNAQTSKIVQHLCKDGHFDLYPGNSKDLNSACILRTSGYSLSFAIQLEKDIEDEYGNVIHYGNELIRIRPHKIADAPKAQQTSNEHNNTGSN